MHCALICPKHEDVLKCILGPQYIIADLECILKHLHASDKLKRNALRNDFNNEICRFLIHNKNKSNKLHTIINRDIRHAKLFFKDRPHVLIIKSDKTKKTVVMHADDYKKKMLDLLEDRNTYRFSRFDPSTKLAEAVNNFLDKLVNQEFIDPKTKENLINRHFTIPRIHGLCKLHKPGQPLRPIVNNINGITDRLAKFLNPALNALNNKNNFDVKNAEEVVVKLNEVNIEQEDEVVSFDVCSLFTNVPRHSVYKILEENWEEIEPHTAIKNKQLFIEGIKLCCDNGYFAYEGKIYKMLFGLPMGGRLSVNLSGILMNKVLNTAIAKSIIKPKLLAKYIDDLLAITNKNHTNTFMEILNSVYKTINFTCEQPTDNKLRFLDILIHTDTLKTEWTKKDIASNRLLNYHSNHPRHHKINTAKNLIKKAIKLTHPTLLNNVKNKIQVILKENWFPDRLIKDIWYKERNNTETNTEDNIETSMPVIEDNQIPTNSVTSTETTNIIRTNRDLITNYFTSTNTTSDNTTNITPRPTVNDPIPRHYSVTHIDGLSHRLHRTIKNNNIDYLKFAYKPKNQLTNIIYSKTKDKIPTDKKTDVVYKIKCNQCPDKYYIGQTSQHLETRISQHKSNCNSKIKKYNYMTGLSTHSTNEKHNFDFKNPTVLHTEQNTDKRKIIEAIYITKHLDKTVNNNTDTENMNFFYANVIENLKLN